MKIDLTDAQLFSIGLLIRFAINDLVNEYQELYHEDYHETQQKSERASIIDIKINKLEELLKCFEDAAGKEIGIIT